jgi:hypothetical protein
MSGLYAHFRKKEIKNILIKNNVDIKHKGNQSLSNITKKIQKTQKQLKIKQIQKHTSLRTKKIQKL